MNPVATEALINLTLGANDPNGSGHGPLPLHAQVRHFDPDRHRAGLAEDVAALVEKITPEGVTLTLVNTHPFAVSKRDRPGRAATASTRSRASWWEGNPSPLMRRTSACVWRLAPARR